MSVVLSERSTEQNISVASHCTPGDQIAIERGILFWRQVQMNKFTHLLISDFQFSFDSSLPDRRSPSIHQSERKNTHPPRPYTYLGLHI